MDPIVPPAPEYRCNSSKRSLYFCTFSTVYDARYFVFMQLMVQFDHHKYIVPLTSCLNKTRRRDRATSAFSMKNFPICAKSVGINGRDPMNGRDGRHGGLFFPVGFLVLNLTTTHDNQNVTPNRRTEVESSTERRQ